MAQSKEREKAYTKEVSNNRFLNVYVDYYSCTKYGVEKRNRAEKKTSEGEKDKKGRKERGIIMNEI